MRRVSEKTKRKRLRGSGEGPNYKPYIKAREVPSIGTSRILVDKKDGRQREFLSQAEVYAYYLLRWDDTVVDIREQYPLELDATLRIADQLGYRHPKDRETRMTTDLYITYVEKDGSLKYKAYSVKESKDVIIINEKDSLEDIKRKNRMVEKLRIEMAYWNLNGIPFEIAYKEEMNKIKVGNIEAVMDYWNINDVVTKIDMIRHLIAQKKIEVDMDSKPLNFLQLVEQYIGDDMKIEELKERILANHNDNSDIEKNK